MVPTATTAAVLGKSFDFHSPPLSRQSSIRNPLSRDASGAVAVQTAFALLSGWNSSSFVSPASVSPTSQALPMLVGLSSVANPMSV